jgi:hypothetical protein
MMKFVAQRPFILGVARPIATRDNAIDLPVTAHPLPPVLDRSDRGCSLVCATRKTAVEAETTDDN